MKKVVYVVLAAMLCLPMSAVKVHTIGDSTMADYNPSATDKRGWGTYLGLFFDPAYVTVNNRGKSGASTRSFYDQAALWSSVKQQMTAGDYVLIQFAHNDEKCNGLDAIEYNDYLKANDLPEATDLRGTCPGTTYKANLRRYIYEVRALGCTPVLVGPICRKYFVDSVTLRRNALHDLGDKFSLIEKGLMLENQHVAADDHSMDYVYQMQEVARETEVPYIDLTSATHDLYLQYGDAYCTAMLFCQGDKTHTSELGAKMIARLAAKLLKEAGILAEYITISDELIAESQEPRAESQEPIAEGKELTTFSFHLSTRNMCGTEQRFHNSDNGTTKTPWPADEIDENAVRYIDLAITAPADSVLRITGIAMDLSPEGTSTMSCHINTGFGESFTDVHTYYEKVAMPRNELTPVAIAPAHLTVPAGQTLHVRILPWLNEETKPRNDKYISLSNIRITGYADKK